VSAMIRVVAIASPEDYDAFNPVFTGEYLIKNSEWHYINSFSRHMKQNGIELIIYAFSSSGKAGLYHSGDRLTRLIEPSKFALKLCRYGFLGKTLGSGINFLRLVRPLLIDSPSVVLSLQFPLFPRNELLTVLSKLFRKKFGCFQSFTLPKGSVWHRTIGRLFNSLVNFFVLTETQALRAIRSYGIQGKVYYVGLIPPYELTEFLLNSASLTRKKAVLFVGRLDDKQKRVSLLLNAFKKVQEKCVDCELLIVGDGFDKPKLEKLTFNLGLRNVRFLGWKSGKELALLYLTSSVFCLPSVSESYAVVVSEAMLAALPVVVSNLPCFSDRIVDGNTGFVFQVGDVETLTKRLLMLLGEPELSREIGENAKKHVLKLINDYAERLCAALSSQE